MWRPPQAPARDDVHASPEELREVLNQTNLIDQRSIRLKVDEEVDVALGVRFTSDDRSEDPDVSGVTATSSTQDLVPLFAQFRK